MALLSGREADKSPVLVLRHVATHVDVKAYRAGSFMEYAGDQRCLADVQALQLDFIKTRDDAILPGPQAIESCMNSLHRVLPQDGIGSLHLTKHLLQDDLSKSQSSERIFTLFRLCHWRHNACCQSR